MYDRLAIIVFPRKCKLTMKKSKNVFFESLSLFCKNIYEKSTYFLVEVQTYFFIS